MTEADARALKQLHAEAAEQCLRKLTETDANSINTPGLSTRALTHATLARYYQTEAEKEEAESSRIEVRGDVSKFSEVVMETGRCVICGGANTRGHACVSDEEAGA